MKRINTFYNYYNLLEESYKTQIITRRYKVNTSQTLIFLNPVQLKYDRLNKINSFGIHTQQFSKGEEYYFTHLFWYFWLYLVFRGKGFRIRNLQEVQRLTLNFGRSHWTKLKFYKTWCFTKRRRQSYLLIYSNFWDYFAFKLSVQLVRKYNKYTQRGLRLKQQGITQRFGKISQYVSLLH